MLVRNGHDGKTPITYANTSIRAVCKNTVNAGMRSALRVFTARHTRNQDNAIEHAQEVLNREINEIDGGELFETGTVEKLLNPKITETKGSTILDTTHIHEALSRGFVSISPASEKIDFTQQVLVNDLLVKIESATPLDTPAHDSVDEVLSYKVTRTIPDLNDSMIDVERLLDSKQ